MYHLRYPETNLYRVLGSHLYTTTPAVDHESNPSSDERRRVKNQSRHGPHSNNHHQTTSL